METVLMKDAGTSLSVLSRLQRMHAWSLPRYLANARPWVGSQQRQAAELLDQIAHDHLHMVDAIGTRILDLQGSPLQTGGFPMEFTDLHDLSAKFVMGQVLARQAEIEATSQKCVEQLAADPESQALAYEAAGMARGHRELLQELLTSSSLA